jgi:Dyp-type peroxidase family
MSTRTRAASTRTPLSLEAREDVQGIVTSGYGHLRFGRFIFFHVDDARPAREWLARLIPQIRTAERWHRDAGGTKDRPHDAVNVAFTRPGFERLGFGRDVLVSFSQEFYLGAAQRAAVLRDTGASAPERWEIGNPNAEKAVHGVLALYEGSAEGIEQLAGEQRRQIAESGGLSILSDEAGNRLEVPREPFGYLDGISQPAIEGVASARDKDVVRTGEFILGYPNEYGILPPTPAVPESADPRGILPPFPGQPRYKDFGKNGTYLVYRKFEQDVAGFWTMIEQTVDRLFGDLDPDEKERRMSHVAAKIAGRWPSGAPLTLAPYEDDPVLGADDRLNNDFGYADVDPYGAFCPVGAHIRRANPRDSLVKDTALSSLLTSNRHRVIRRGMPYGDRLVDASDFVNGKAPRGLRDDGRPRGLHFFIVNAQIKRQFEFVMAEWIANPQFGGLFGAGDTLLANEGGNVIFQRRPLRSSFAQLNRFTTVRGSAYLFVPSITSLRYLVSMPSAPAPTAERAGGGR